MPKLKKNQKTFQTTFFFVEDVQCSFLPGVDSVWLQSIHHGFFGSTKCLSKFVSLWFVVEHGALKPIGTSRTS